MPAVFSRKNTKRNSPHHRSDNPSRGMLARYHNRIVEVMGEARGQRVMIRSIHPDGIERRTAVKWTSLAPMEACLFALPGFEA